jgi:peptidyl-prolyl cis-trans isomerase C
MIKKVVFLLAIVPLLFSLSCNKKVAEGDGWSIGAKEFREKYESLPPDAAPFLAYPDGKKRYLDSLILREIIYHEAEKEGVTKDPIVKNRIEDAKKRVVIEEYLKRKLEGGLTPTKEDQEKYYLANKAAFDGAKTIRVEHILVKTKDEAEKIKKLIEEGESFENLARENSICPTAPSGGDLGYFGRGEMVPEFDEAAFALKKPGDISPIIETRFGFHIIKLIDKDHLMEKFVAEKRDELIDDYLEEMKGKTQYKINEKNLTFED